MPTRDGDPANLRKTESLLCGGERRDLGADAKPVAGILHVGAEHDLPVHRLYRAADAEAGIRGVGAERRPAGMFDERVLGHGPLT